LGEVELTIPIFEPVSQTVAHVSENSLHSFLPRKNKLSCFVDKSELDSQRIDHFSSAVELLLALCEFRLSLLGVLFHLSLFQLFLNIFSILLFVLEVLLGEKEGMI